MAFRLTTLQSNAGSISLSPLNPETLNQNLFGYNYPGPSNPKKYNGDSDYSVPPTEFEKPAFVHDQDYDKVGAVGAGGLFLDINTIEADKKFVNSMDNWLRNMIKMENLK